MKFNWKLHSRFWAGTVCALSLWWVSFVLINLFYHWFSRWVGEAWLVPTVIWIALQIVLVPAGGWVAGLGCAFLWHPVATRVTCERWGALVVLLALALLLFSGGEFLSVLALLVVAFVCALMPFHRGINHGFRLWHEGYWRNFVGATNDWERDDETKSL